MTVVVLQVSRERMSFFAHYDDGKFHDLYVKNKKLDPYPVPYQKISSIRTNDLNIEKKV